MSSTNEARPGADVANVARPFQGRDRLVIFAPNWLGDAVMALPAIADVRRAYSDATLTVAARPAVAPLFALVPEIDSVVDVNEIRGTTGGQRFDVAILLPNSFNSALAAYRARIPERCGYRADCRGPLLTRAVARPRGRHQVAYYQQLVAALGIANGSDVPRIDVSSDLVAAGARLLREAGWDGVAPIVGLAPGAAYGGAKRWPPDRFGDLARGFAADGIAAVMVGSGADAATGREVEQAAGSARIVNLIGRTSLAELAGVLPNCRALVSNDSGAMHLAAAAGVPVTALFGPTDETATAPPRALDPRPSTLTRILVHPVWCRPCMLRECPLDHACMRGIAVADVRAALDARWPARQENSGC